MHKNQGFATLLVQAAQKRAREAELKKNKEIVKEPQVENRENSHA